MKSISRRQFFKGSTGIAGAAALMPFAQAQQIPPHCQNVPTKWDFTADVVVVGAMVKTGKVKRSDKARLIRDGIVIFTGNINALKRFKDDVKEVGTNFECGISLVNCNDMKVGDMIEAFEEIEVKQTL